MLALQTQLKNLKLALRTKNENIKFDKNKDKERLYEFQLNEMFKDDIEDKPITLQEALDFEIDYINHKNNKINSIPESKTEKKTSTVL